MTDKIKLKQGDQVKWHSAAGHLTGAIKSIKPAMNAAGYLIDWIVIERHVISRMGRPMMHTTRLAYTKNNMAMMKVEAI